MRLGLGRSALLAAGIASLVFGCASSSGPAPASEEPPEVVVASIPEPSPPKPLPPVARPQALAPAALPVAAPLDKPAEPAPAPSGEIAVTEEIYTKTFDELEARIREWSAIIARKDYDSWHKSLSRAYVAERGSPEYLAELSRNQKLRERGVSLKSLRDYFSSVVVPARVDAALDKIAFVGENKVKAYALIDGEAAILYYVVREDGTWKIGTSGE